MLRAAEQYYKDPVRGLSGAPMLHDFADVNGDGSAVRTLARSRVHERLFKIENL